MLKNRELDEKRRSTKYHWPKYDTGAGLIACPLENYLVFVLELTFIFTSCLGSSHSRFVINSLD